MTSDRYPNRVMIDGMSQEDLVFHLAEARLVVQRVEERMKGMGVLGLYLVAFEPRDKIRVITAIRALNGFGLREAKALCDAVERGDGSQLVISSVPKDHLHVKHLTEFATIEWR